MSITYRKITHGYVVQLFNKQGKPLRQYFIAEDQVEYEKETSRSIDGTRKNIKSGIQSIKIEDMPLKGQEYLAFDMK